MSQPSRAEALLDKSVQHQVHGVEEVARKALEEAPLLVPWSPDGGARERSCWTARRPGPGALVRSLGERRWPRIDWIWQEIGAPRARAGATGG